MKRIAAILLLMGAATFVAALAARAAEAPSAAARVLDLGPRKGKPVEQGDTGLYGMSLSADAKTLWLGRARGARKVDLATGAWKFFPGAACDGENFTSMADTGGALWAVTATEGRLCRLDTATGRWSLPGGWKMRERVFGATKLLFVPSREAAPGQPARLLVNGQGGPDTEGITIIDPAAQTWLELLKTKPVYDFDAGASGIVAATWDGILKIDTNKKFSYTLHSAHGCGAEVTGVVTDESGGSARIVIATKPSRHTELGEAMKVFRDGVAVFAPAPGRPYSFRWRHYRRDESKRLNADYYRLFRARDFDTPGGICWLQNGKWRRLDETKGLPSNKVLKLADGGARLFAATDSGLAVIEKNGMAVTKTLPGVKDVIALAPAPDGLWVAAEGNLVFFIGNAALGVRAAK